MAEFVVEHYVARSGADRFRRDAEGARRAAEQLTSEGTPVTYLRSIFVPEDETCYVFYRPPRPTPSARPRSGLSSIRACRRGGHPVWIEREATSTGAAPGRDEGRAMSHPDDTADQTRLSRRGFLGKVGVGAVAVGASGGLGVGVARAKPQAPARRYAATTQHFGRIFQRMEPFVAPGRRGLEAALVDIGSPGGILDADDALERSPADLITDLSLSTHNPNNPTHTAGTTFFGQFMDHDMTSTPRPRWASPRRPSGLSTADTVVRPRLGVRGGPVGSPQLYDPVDRAKLKVESGGLFEDVPRMADGTAIIAIPATTNTS